MDFEFSSKVKDLQAQLSDFMDEHIYPNEQAYAQQLHTAENRYSYLPLMDELKQKAKAAGLWNLFVPPSLTKFADHDGLRNLNYGPLAERNGRDLWLPEVINCNAPDTGTTKM